MNSRRLPWIIGLVALVAAVALWAYRVRQVDAGDARTLIRTAWTEGRRVALEGSQLIEMPGPDGKPVTVRARVLTSREGYVRIEYVTDPLKGVTVWENGEKTYRYSPQEKRLTVARKRAAEGEGDDLQFLENYEARVVGREEVAGRPALVVELRPRGEGRIWKTFSIDRKTGVVLASSDREGADRVLRSTRFLEVEYLSQSPNATAFTPPADLLQRYGTARPGDTSSRFEPEALSRLLGFKVRVPTWTPVGYTFKGAYQALCPCGNDHQAARLVYTDGLNTITLLECGNGKHASLDTCFSKEVQGDMAVAERPVLDGVQWYFLALGNVPREELQRLVKSALP